MPYRNQINLNLFEFFDQYSIFKRARLNRSVRSNDIYIYGIVYVLRVSPSQKSRRFEAHWDFRVRVRTVSIYMHADLYTCMLTYIYACWPIFMHADLYTCMLTYIHAWLTYIHTWLTYIHAWLTYIHECWPIYMNADLHTWMLTYIHACWPMSSISRISFFFLRSGWWWQQMQI